MGRKNVVCTGIEEEGKPPRARHIEHEALLRLPDADPPWLCVAECNRQDWREWTEGHGGVPSCLARIAVSEPSSLLVGRLCETTYEAQALLPLAWSQRLAA